MAAQTFTLNILNIAPIGSNVWRIAFNPDDSTVTSDSNTNPITYGTAVSPINLNPFLNTNLSFKDLKKFEFKKQ